MKTTQLIRLFLLIFSGAVLLGNTPVWAEDTSEYTYVSVNYGQFEASIDGGVLRDPCYYDPVVEECKDMTEATEAWICNGEPLEDKSNCRRFNYGNVCFAVGSGVSWGGTSYWFYW